MRRAAVIVMLVGLLGGFWLGPEPACACLHAKAGLGFPLSAGAQRGLIFFDDGHEELVLNPSYELDTSGSKKRVQDDAVKGFTKLAWLVPTPSLPTSYKEADEAIFTDLAAFTEEKEIVETDSDDEKKDDGPNIGEDGGDEGIEFLEVLEVGDYTIQPIKATGETGKKDLQAWLKENGFSELDEGVLDYYQGEGYYWLAITLALQKGGGLPAGGALKPLQISFETEKPVYPLKVNAGGGIFDLELWVIARKEIDLMRTRVYGIRTAEQRDDFFVQENRQTEFSKLPETVQAVIAEVEALEAMKEGKIYCYRFAGRDLDEVTDLSKLADDLHFEFQKEEKKKKK